jgi:TolB-like protein/DNA-binding winged helix-turn-helix (wHTH) protein
LEFHSSSEKIRFDVFEVDTAAKELRKYGTRVKLSEQPFQALALLLERAGQLVTREEFQKRLWAEGVFVDFERGLNKVINRLREVLGDDADHPKYIETLPQRGYRFIGEIRADPVARPELADPERPPAAFAPNRIGRRAAITGLAASAAVVSGFAVWRRQEQFKIESIAVLPLDNLSGDPAQEFFADGMTDELIGELARIRSVRVISRTSAMRYKGQAKKSLREIARELGVDAIVEGSVAKAGGHVRITAQLIRASDDRPIWSGRYERELADVLALQNDVARAISAQVRKQIDPETRSPRRVAPEAHETYLKAYASPFIKVRSVFRAAWNCSAGRWNWIRRTIRRMRDWRKRFALPESFPGALPRRPIPRPGKWRSERWNWTRTTRRLTTSWRT